MVTDGADGGHLTVSLRKEQAWHKGREKWVGFPGEIWFPVRNKEESMRVYCKSKPAFVISHISFMDPAKESKVKTQSYYL
jgi:hypothetical protein